MASSVTLATLRRQARELADNEGVSNEQFVDDTELDGMINSSLGQWYSKIARAVPERFESAQTITPNGSLNGYTLPSDYYTTLSVEYEESNGYPVDLHRVMYHERNAFTSRVSSRALGYRVALSRIYLLPPVSTGTYTHRYVFVPPALTLSTSAVDGINGWEQWVVYDVAAKMLIKEQTDPTWVIRERDRIEKLIDDAAQDRELANPKRIVDVRTRAAQWRYNTPGFRDPDFFS